MTTTLIQATNGKELQTKINAIITAGKTITLVVVCHSKTEYLVYHTV